MITFDNVRIKDNITVFLVPIGIVGSVSKLMKRGNIEHIVYNRHDIDLEDIRKKYCITDQNKIDAAIKFQEYTNGNPKMITALISYCDTDDLYQLSQLVYGDNIDADFATEIDAKDAEHKEYNDYHEKTFGNKILVNSVR